MCSVLAVPAILLAASTNETPKHSVQAATAVKPIAISPLDDRADMIDLHRLRASRSRAVATPKATPTRSAPRVHHVTVPKRKIVTKKKTVRHTETVPTGTGYRAWAASSGVVKLRNCENGGSYRSDPGDYYRGAYQFSRSTWGTVGGSGDPAAASPSEQDYRAWMLYKRDGRSPWPVCGRYL